MPPIKKTDCSGMCKKCDMNLHEEAIQCTQCSCLYHLTCSELPLYKLVEYVKSRTTSTSANVALLETMTTR